MDVYRVLGGKHTHEGCFRGAASGVFGGVCPSHIVVRFFFYRRGEQRETGEDGTELNVLVDDHQGKK